ncbi:hypothetical protein WJX74_001596 [Apatococcus lobatus]|uniref:Tafazzin family protein n=2 Tax=Apatococcus TaxID=904362 RepID=A0AAW1T772_9CHLO
MDSLVEPEDLRDPVTQPPWGQIGRNFTLGMVSLAGKFVLQVCNRMDIKDHARLTQLVMHRPPGTGLITVSNHASTFDDPGLLSALLPWHYFWSEGQHGGVRWSLCARDICFRGWFLSQFFLNGKVLPIDRGGGMQQPIMNVAARQVQRGKWLHVFPEGKLFVDGSMGPFKWGIGKMVCDSMEHGRRQPVILPLFHSGMGRVLPKGSVVPRVGHEVTVLVGEPIDLSDITCRCNQSDIDQQQVWKEITARIRAAMVELEDKAPPNWVQEERTRPLPPRTPSVDVQQVAVESRLSTPL